MSRNLALALSLVALFVLFVPVALADPVVTIAPLPANPAAATTPANGLQVTFGSTAPNNLFLFGKPVTLTAHITNAGAAQQAKITFTLRSGLGCIVFQDVSQEALPEKGTLDKSYTIGDNTSLPRGPYIADIKVIGEKDWGFQDTHIGIWDAPHERAVAEPAPSGHHGHHPQELPAGGQSDWFGISYLGPLNTARTLSDLDLFKHAGVGWIRFPLHGWIPQGEPAPPDADRYNTFIQQASDRGFKLMAAFTPQITVDSSVNAIQAAKDFHESLLSASARYGFKVKVWELLKVPPPSYPRGLNGIDFGEIKLASAALQRFDKSLQVIFPVDGSALLDNANTWFLNGQPSGNNALGIHYNLNDLPETQQTSGSNYTKPPTYESSRMGEIANTSSKTSKKTKINPNFWVTEYGFDAKFLRELKDLDTYQAALLSRMIIMNRMSYPRVFWRHNPDNAGDVPFTSVDNSVQPTLLALRTTLEQLDGLSEMIPIFSSLVGQERGVNMYILRFGGDGKKHKNAHYKLVAWSDRVRSRASMAMLTSTAQVKITDLWGNTEDLLPTGNVAIFQLDEFPHFIDLGTDSKIELMNATGTANFTAVNMTGSSAAAPYKIVAPGADNTMAFRLQNNQKIFNNNIAGKLVFNVWPDLYQDVVTMKDPFGFEIKPYNSSQVTCANFEDHFIPDDAQTMRELCEVNVDIYSGDRRMGYLTLPVYFSPKLRAEEK